MAYTCLVGGWRRGAGEGEAERRERQLGGHAPACESLMRPWIPAVGEPSPGGRRASASGGAEVRTREMPVPPADPKHWGEVLGHVRWPEVRSVVLIALFARGLGSTLGSSGGFSPGSAPSRPRWREVDAALRRACPDDYVAAREALARAGLEQEAALLGEYCADPPFPRGLVAPEEVRAWAGGSSDAAWPRGAWAVWAWANGWVVAVGDPAYPARWGRGAGLLGGGSEVSGPAMLYSASPLPLGLRAAGVRTLLRIASGSGKGALLPPARLRSTFYRGDEGDGDGVALSGEVEGDLGCPAASGQGLDDPAGLEPPPAWLAIVGTRQPSPGALEVIGGAVRLAAAQGWGVVSGGAIGVDSWVRDEALRHGVPLIELLPVGAFPLGRGATSGPRSPDGRREHRCSEGQGAIHLRLSVAPWGAPFSTAQAMERNGQIASMAEAQLVIEPRFRAGGSWAGAIETLRRKRTPLFVWAAEPSAANGAPGAIGGSGAAVPVMSGESVGVVESAGLAVRALCALGASAWDHEAWGLAADPSSLESGAPPKPLKCWQDALRSAQARLGGQLRLPLA